MQVTEEQRGVLLHALGLTRQAEAYRNHYAAEPGDETCNALVEAGYMREGREIEGGLVYYHVTEEGRRVAYGLAQYGK